jgi:dTDP-4-amino-4,6-dideoxygalactose transaminase
MGEKMNIPANRLDRGFRLHQAEYETAVLRVLRSGWYVLGNEVAEFENEFAAYVGAKHCVGLASGLDALWIAFRLLNIGEGDEVIVPANTYIASVMGVTMNGNGATPIFVEPDAYHNIDPDKIETAITARTKAILPVHLYGQACDMEAITYIAKRHNLRVVEDCAQSHGAKQSGRRTGTFGDIGCFSFYPSKNLGAFGDAGAIVTNDDETARMFRVYRNYGSEKRYCNMVVGANARLDEMQAALLRVRLTHLDELNAERRSICNKYLSDIANPALVLPAIRQGCETVWHQFVVRVKERERFIDHLKKRGIGSIIHYPIPPHLSRAYAHLGHRRGDFPITERHANEVLSLPLFNGMTETEQNYVIKEINEYADH